MTAPEPWSQPERWPLPIETERLVLRAPTHDDAPAMFAAIEASRPSLHPWLPWPKTENHSLAQTHYTIETFARQRAESPTPHLHLAIFDRASGAYLGGTGLHTFRPDAHQAETGYWIAQEHRQRSICTEAVIGLTRACFCAQAEGGFGLRRIEICCSAHNAASARVADRAGYAAEGRLLAHRWVDGYGWSDTLIFAALAGTWSTP
ncbi:MAG: GNAT family protein [Planctomycetota bacterium]